MRVVRVREEVVLLQRPRDAFPRFRREVTRGGRIHRSHAAILVDVLDDLVEVLEPGQSVRVLEITPHRPHDVTPARLALLRQCGFDEVVDPRLHVVILERWVVLHGLVVRRHVPIETAGGAVISLVLASESSEHLCARPQRGRRAPNELSLFLFLSDVEILIIDAAEEKPLEADLSRQKCRLRRGVAEGIELPTVFRENAELVHQEFMAQRGLVDHVHVERCCLVMHAPAAVGHFERT
mmetsp:Transcript_6181/g.15352  ORF Transcript_6181/g.15352 Transcript_6181/m.15352 type:complete len:238 (-) Transcript_6181:295-1008(-)